MFKQIWFINSHKIVLPPLVIAMMFAFGNFSAEAFIYLAIHGTYCALWHLKQAWFRDERFQQRVPLWIGIIFIFVPLGGYYVAPYLLISRHLQLAPAYLAAVLCIYTFGIFFHYVSDAQKRTILTYHPGLITEGVFSRTRNPNYFGEILIYVAYAMMSLSWIPFAILAGWVFGFFVPNMLKKDKSISRYWAFAQYKQHSGLVIPKIV